MLRLFVPLAALCVGSASLFAQAPSIIWQRSLGGTAGDGGESIRQTSDGGYVLVGGTESTDGDVTCNPISGTLWVVKLDDAGSMLWQSCLGGSGSDAGWCIQQTADGGYIVSGQTASTDGDVSGNHGGYDFWVVKLDPTGGLIWQRALGGLGTETTGRVVQTADGGYVGVCSTASNSGDVTGNHGGKDGWVVRLDANGTLLWQRALGGFSDDFGTDIIPLTDGYLVYGTTASDNNGDVGPTHGLQEHWAVKLDATGGLVWQMPFGGSGHDGGYSVTSDGSGNYVACGNTNSNDGQVSGNHGPSDLWVIDFDGSGSLAWQKALGGSMNEFGRQVQHTSDGGFVVVGETNSNDGDVTGNHGDYDVWVVKLDASGDLSWQLALGGSASDVGRAIEETSDGGFILTGETWSNDGDVSGQHGFIDAWVVKLGGSPEGLAEPHGAPAFTLAHDPGAGAVYLTMAQVPAASVLVLRNAVGQVVFTQRLSTRVSDIDVGGLSPGVYLFSVGTNEGWTTQRLVLTGR